MRRFLRLPFRQKQIAIVAVVMALRIKRRVRRHGYAPTNQWLASRSRQPVPDPIQAAGIASLAQAATAAMPGSFNCLIRSLLVWWLIGGDELARIRFGVGSAEDGEDLRFHAWVEMGNVVVNDAPDVGNRYSAFANAPASELRFD